MKISVRSTLLAAVFAAGFAGAAQAQYYREVPALRYEVVPPPRGDRFLWQPGHWGWNGYRHVWAGGRYVERRPQWDHYEHGRWENRYGRPLWVAPGWR